MNWWAKSRLLRSTLLYQLGVAIVIVRNAMRKKLTYMVNLKYLYTKWNHLKKSIQFYDIFKFSLKIQINSCSVFMPKSQVKIYIFFGVCTMMSVRAHTELLLFFLDFTILRICGQYKSYLVLKASSMYRAQCERWLWLVHFIIICFIHLRLHCRM